jgi:putative transposase
MWRADFKGEFLLGCEAKYSVAHIGAQESCERLFAPVGLLVSIRTDNGCPFRGTAIAGLSRIVTLFRLVSVWCPSSVRLVSVWWMTLGVLHPRIEPGKPHQSAPERPAREDASDAEGADDASSGAEHEAHDASAGAL